MDAASYIIQRQVLWARRHGIELQGSAGERGKPTYTRTLQQNLFEPLSDEARAEFEHGDGHELTGAPCKMQAVHSTAALAVNVFHYWKRLGRLALVARACGLPAAGVRSLAFERQLPIALNVNRRRFPRDPNLDVVLTYGDRQGVKAAGIECKFTEAYSGRGHDGLRPPYLEEADLWQGLVHCRDLAEGLSPADTKFKYLHAAQLLKHILGLKHAHGIRGFRLLYLWYEAPGEAGATHGQEAEEFAATVRQDGIAFQVISYQQVILNLARQQRDRHKKYIDYLAERYLDGVV